jgi:hypothetical protein
MLLTAARRPRLAAVHSVFFWLQHGDRDLSWSRSAQDRVDKLKQFLDDTATLTDDPAEGPQKKRCRSKPSHNDSQRGETDLPAIMSALVKYRYTLDELVRTRQQAVGVAAQRLPRRLLRHLVPQTRDLDIENSVFVIMYQLVLKLELVTAIPVQLMQILAQCANERDTVIANELRMSPSEGKKTLNATLNGAALKAPHSDNSFLKGLQKLARYLRWLACSLLPDVHARCKQENRRCPETSTMYYMWTAIEDQIMQSWITYIRNTYKVWECELCHGDRSNQATADLITRTWSSRCRPTGGTRMNRRGRVISQMD